MNLASLKAFCEIVAQDLHLSNAAQRLHRSQPALTRQIQQLEIELGVQLFKRSRNRLIGLTEQGEAILVIAQRVTHDTEDIARLANESIGDIHGEKRGELTVASTHTQARYTLLPVVSRFMAEHPKVNLSLQQGSPTQCCEMVARGIADIAVTTETAAREDVVQIPCYRLQRVVVTPPRHPLLREKPLMIQALARYPIITYAVGVAGRTAVDRSFRKAGLTPNITFNAIDADVGKDYVAIGMGVAILVGIAFDRVRDKPLRALDASHLFDASLLNLVVRPNAYFRAYTLDFIRGFAPHLSAAELQQACTTRGLRTQRRELPIR